MKEANFRQPPQHLKAWEQNRWRLREQARVDDRMLRKQKGEIKALYRRRQYGQISQAEYSERLLGITQDGSPNDSDKGRFWELFTVGAIAATAAVVLLISLIDPDECSNAYATLMMMLAFVPAGVVIGVIGLAARSQSGLRGLWTLFAVLFTPFWMLWVLSLLVGMGLVGGSRL